MLAPGGGSIYKPMDNTSQSRMADKMTRPDAQPSRPSRWSVTVLAGDIAGMIRFFSRLPVPKIGRDDDPAALPDFTRAAGLIPIAGLGVALPGAALLFLLSFTALPTLICALVAVGLGIAVTGALHEDGLADVADGFFGASRPERRLDIMKDSRIGAFGTLALILAVSAKVLLLATLLERYGAMGTAFAWLGAEAVSRAVMTGVWHALPAARSDGLAALCGAPDRRSVVIACVLAMGTMLPAAFTLSISAAASGIVLAIASGLGLVRLARAKIGGQTGDVLGATQQVAILSALLGLCMVAPAPV